MEASTDNKHNILNKALELFSEFGYDSVGVQMLCEKSGITKPTLYYYFGNKEGVLKELLKINYEQLNNLLAEKATYKPNPQVYLEDVFPVLKNVANAYFQFAKNNAKFYQMVLFATYGPDTSTTRQAAGEGHLKQYEIVENMFRAMAEQHNNMRGKEKRLTWTFIGMINTYIGLGKFSEDTPDDAVKQFMHGIYN